MVLAANGASQSDARCLADLDEMQTAKVKKAQREKKEYLLYSYIEIFYSHNFENE